MSDFSKTLDAQEGRRREYNFVRAHAPELLDKLLQRSRVRDLIAHPGDREDVARCAVQLAQEMYKALPPDPDAETRAKPPASLAERFARLADCQLGRGVAEVAAYHDHLASSGLQSCGACGVRLEVAVHELLPAEPEQTRRSCDPGPATEVQP